MSRILVVDDEAGIRQIIKKYACFEGYDVAEAANGMEAIEFCRQNHVDLIVMDIMMPELDGFSACREIRRFCSVPVIMLSARGEEYDRINGFEAGSDDYVVKPFSPRELMLRIGAVLRRSGTAVEEEVSADVLEFGGLRIDQAARIVWVDGERRSMSPKEYELLLYLVANRGRALTREAIISAVWGYDYYGDDRTLDTHIKLLRKSLGVYARYIVTLRGVGYRFDENV